MADWPQLVTGAHGKQVEVAVAPGEVSLNGVQYDAAGQEQFAQAFVAACHEAAALGEAQRTAHA